MKRALSFLASAALLGVVSLAGAPTSHAAPATSVAHQVMSNNMFCGGQQPPGPNHPPPNPGGGGPYYAYSGGAPSVGISTSAGVIPVIIDPGTGGHGNVPGQGNPNQPEPGYGNGAGHPGCLAIWTDSASYRWGDWVYACYTVPGPGWVEIGDYHFTSHYSFSSYSGPDDGSGGCGVLGQVGMDTGWRSLSLTYTPYYGGQVQAATYYWGQQ